MALRKIVLQGDECLTKVCRPVTEFNQRLHTLIDDMKETLLDSGGVGLAAPQVGVLRRVCVVMNEDEDIIELVNPEIIAAEGEQTGLEGCLSIPGKFGIVTRPYTVRVRAQDRDGNFFEVEDEELTARCFCHEIEHLDGHLFVEHTDHLIRPFFRLGPYYHLSKPYHPLRRLVEDGHEICGVFTQPDKPKNRGHKLAFSPVKEYALSQGLTVYQPVKLRDGTALELIRSLAPELTVVAAYGRILPEDILAAPKLGSINVHSSLLPKYRGAAPINWAVLNGDAVTGVTIMYMAKELDAGDIISAAETPIDPDEDALTLTNRLAELGAETLSRTVQALAAGTAGRTKQDESAVTFAPMLSRELSPMDFTRPARSLHDQVRGLQPWPCAVTELSGATVKVYRTAVGGAVKAAPGTIVRADKTGIEIACGDGRTLRILELQPQNGKRMAAASYLAGHPVQVTV